MVTAQLSGKEAQQNLWPGILKSHPIILLLSGVNSIQGFASYLAVPSYLSNLGNGYYKRLPIRVWRDNGLHLQHRLAQAGPDHQGVDPPQAQQPS